MILKSNLIILKKSNIFNKNTLKIIKNIIKLKILNRYSFLIFLYLHNNCVEKNIIIKKILKHKVSKYPTPVLVSTKLFKKNWNKKNNKIKINKIYFVFINLKMNRGILNSWSLLLPENVEKNKKKKKINIYKNIICTLANNAKVKNKPTKKRL